MLYPRQVDAHKSTLARPIDTVSIAPGESDRQQYPSPSLNGPEDNSQINHNFVMNTQSRPMVSNRGLNLDLSPTGYPTRFSI